MNEGFTAEERSSYGLKYNFSLKDKANEAAVDAPEWLVPQVKWSVMRYDMMWCDMMWYGMMWYDVV